MSSQDNPTYFAKAADDWWEVWQTLGDSQRRVCVVMCGGRAAARFIAEALNEKSK